MSENQAPKNQGGQAALIAVGAVLILFGLSSFGDAVGFYRILQPFGSAFGAVRQWFLPIAALVAGILLIVFASKGGVEFRVPSKSDRLYRSQGDKMISGVVGGLANYFGVDSTIPRLGVVAIALFTDAWPVIVTYLIASVVVPVEPASPAQGGEIQ